MTMFQRIEKTWISRMKAATRRCTGCSGPGRGRYRSISTTMPSRMNGMSDPKTICTVMKENAEPGR